MQDCPLCILLIEFTIEGQSSAAVNHRLPQSLFSTNHQIPLWSQIILISQLFRVFAFVCLAHQMGGSLTFGSNSLDDIMPGIPNQSQKSDLKFLITQLYHINQLLHEFCKAPLECAVSDSCLACLPTPGPSVVPVN